MDIRITLSRPTVKAMQQRLRQAYERGDMRLVRRTSVLLEYLHGGTGVADLHARWGLGASTVYNWLEALMLHGVASLCYAHGGGRPAKLTAGQKKQLCQWLDESPQAHGFAPACWTSVLIQELIRREFGVLYNRFYLCALLRNLGYSYQKARQVSDHLDPPARQRWKDTDWPRILATAQQRQAMLLFGDEAYCPQWGSLGYSWSKRGEPLTVPTAGKRKAYKLFGLIDYFTGRFFHQNQDGRFTAEAYQAFLLTVLAQTRKHIYLIQDGARYHTSKAMRLFFAQHRARLTVCQLPSYSPDLNPIEYLWRKLKRRATHSKYFAEFTQLIASVDEACAYLAQHPAEVRQLFANYCCETDLLQSA